MYKNTNFIIQVNSDQLDTGGQMLSVLASHIALDDAGVGQHQLGLIGGAAGPPTRGVVCPVLSCG